MRIIHWSGEAMSALIKLSNSSQGSVDKASAHGAVDAFGKDIQSRRIGRVLHGTSVVRHGHGTVQIMRFCKSAQRHFLSASLTTRLEIILGMVETHSTHP